MVETFQEQTDCCLNRNNSINEEIDMEEVNDEFGGIQVKSENVLTELKPVDKNDFPIDFLDSILDGKN